MLHRVLAVAGTALLLVAVALIPAMLVPGCASDHGDVASTAAPDTTASTAQVTQTSGTAPASSSPSTTGPSTATSTEVVDSTLGMGRYPAASAKLGYGYIDKKGNWAIQPQYKFAYPFSDDLGLVLLDELPDLWGYLDESGAWVIEPRYQSARPFSEGLARVSVEDDSGAQVFSCIDASGRVVLEIPADISMVGDFSEGLAVAWQDDEYGYIDTTGAWVIEPRFMQAGDFSEGLAPVVETPGLFGYIETTGEWVIEPRFDDARSFSEGLALVSEGGDHGFIDVSGEFVISPRFDGGYGFSEGLAVVGEDGVYGYIDSRGEWILPPQYYVAESFSGGLARVSIPDGLTLRSAYIDRAGTVVFWHESYEGE